jgi:hypothetical protein
MVDKMDVTCGMIKLKANSLDTVRQWTKVMNERKNEALQTIQNEGITVESVFLAKIGGDDFLVYYIRANDLQKSREVFKNSLMEIDLIHQQFKKDCWDVVSSTELLLDLESK